MRNQWHTRQARQVRVLHSDAPCGLHIKDFRYALNGERGRSLASSPPAFPEADGCNGPERCRKRPCATHSDIPYKSDELRDNRNQLVVSHVSSLNYPVPDRVQNAMHIFAFPLGKTLPRSLSPE